MTARPAVMSWSSGKDSAMALHVARQDPTLQIIALISTFSESSDRVAVHGTRPDIVRAQAAALGLSLIEVGLPTPCPNAIYETRMGDALSPLVSNGVRDVVFGDLFLADIRTYREAQMAPLGLRAHFPLWGRDTGALAQEMLSAGIDARIVALDPSRMPPNLAGARFDHDMLAALPPMVDPCGERGEFHTVVANAPGFKAPLDLVRGATTEHSGFVYTDFSLTPRG